MPFDSSTIPDTAADLTPAPPKTTGGGFDPDSIPDTAGASQAPGLPMQGAPTGIDFSQYKFQPKTDFNNNLYRAQAQSGWTQLGLALGNTVANAATGIISDAAEIPELFDKTQDYSNAVTRAMAAAHNPLGEIYREHPDQTFDLTDPGWWMDQFQGLLTAAARYGAEGWALGGVFGALGGAAAEGLASGSAAARTGIRMGARALTSASMGAIMSAGAGEHIYSQAYDYQYRKMLAEGASPDEASQRASAIAGHAAATGVKTAFVLNAALDMAALAPMFRAPKDEVADWIRSEMKAHPDASLDQIKEMLQSAPETSPELQKILKNRGSVWSSRAMSAAQMSGVMLNLQHAEAEGKREGEHPDAHRTLWNALTDVGTYLDDVTNKEGLLAVLTGAFTGFGQSAILDAVPSKFVARYDENNEPILKRDAENQLILDPKTGTYKTAKHMVSPRSANEFGARNYYDNAASAILADVKRLQDLHAQLSEATLKGNTAEADQIRSEIFAVTALDSVQKGQGDLLKNTYQQIADTDNTKPLADSLQPELDAVRQAIKEKVDAAGLPEPASPEEARVQNQKLREADPELDQLVKRRDELLARQKELGDKTEAMQKGYANSPEDNEYKQRATDFMADLDHLATLHTQIVHKYYDPLNPHTEDLTSILFNHAALLHLRQRVIDREEGKLAAEQAAGLPQVDPVQAALRDYWNYRDAIEPTVQQLEKDIATFQQAGEKFTQSSDTGDLEPLKELIRKYGGKGVGDQDILSASKELGEALLRKRDLYQKLLKSHAERLEENSLFNEWKQAHPEDSFEDFVDKAREAGKNDNRRRGLEVLKANQDIAKEQYEKMTSKEGARDMLKKIQEGKKEMVRKLTDQIHQGNAEDFLKAQEKKAVADMQYKDRLKEASRLKQEITELRDSLQQDRDKLYQLQTELRDKQQRKKILRHLGEIRRLRSEIKALKDTIRSKEYQLSRDRDRLDMLNVNVSKAARRKAQTETATNEELKNEPPTPPTPAEPPPSEQPAPEETPPAAEKATPTDTYAALLSSIQKKSPGAAATISRLEQQYKSSGLEPSLQELQDALKLFPTVDANEVYLKMRDYLDELKTPPVPPKDEEPGAEAEPEPEIEDGPVEEGLVQPSLQPEIRMNKEIFSDDSNEQKSVHWDEKAPKLRDVMAVASADTQSMHTRNEGGEGGIRRIIDRLNNNSVMLDEISDKSRMIPGVISEGDELILRIEPDRTKPFEVLNYDTSETDEFHRQGRTVRYLNHYLKDGKINMLSEDNGWGSVPIQIVHKKTGKVIGYVHNMGWVSATYGSEDYAHVVSTITEKDKRGKVYTIDNMKEQRRRLAQLRHAVAEAWNENPLSTFETTVNSRNSGHIMLTRKVTEIANAKTGEVIDIAKDEDGNPRYKYIVGKATRKLPDPSLQFGVIAARKKVEDSDPNGMLVMKAGGDEVVKQLTSHGQWVLENCVGSPVAIIPTPGGEVDLQPLKTAKLSDGTQLMTTLKRVIELHLQSREGKLDDKGRQIIEKIKEETTRIETINGKERKTKIDITTVTGLRRFLEQYLTYTTSFDDRATFPDADPVIDSEGKEHRPAKFMLQVKSGDIKVGTRYVSNGSVPAKLGADGKLDPYFESVLESGLYDRYRAVNLAHPERHIIGVNDGQPFKAIYIDKADKLKVIPYDNYNAYLKDFTYTAVDGTHRLGADGKEITDEDIPGGIYVYFANSRVGFDAEPIIGKGPEKKADTVAEKIPAKEPEQVGEEVSEEDEGDMSMGKPIRTQAYTVRPDGLDLTDDNLSQLQKAGPKNERSGLTPEEVRILMRDDKIDRLPDGYDPFRTC